MTSFNPHPFFPVDCIWATMFVWRLRVKITRTVSMLCCVQKVYTLCVHVRARAHTEMNSSYRWMCSFKFLFVFFHHSKNTTGISTHPILWYISEFQSCFFLAILDLGIFNFQSYILYWHCAMLHPPFSIFLFSLSSCECWKLILMLLLFCGIFLVIFECTLAEALYTSRHLDIFVQSHRCICRVILLLFVVNLLGNIPRMLCLWLPHPVHCTLLVTNIYNSNTWNWNKLQIIVKYVHWPLEHSDCYNQKRFFTQN